jgi:putative SOS response-associated peptidase YedK
MCGRFTLHISPEELSEILGLIEIPIFPAKYNIAPTQPVAVIRQNGDGQNRLDMLRWGLIPSWVKEKFFSSPLINARCETVAEKPAFRHAIKYRRRVIQLQGFLNGKRKVRLRNHFMSS